MTVPRSIQFGTKEATIADLSLSTRARNCLKNAGLCTVVDVVQLHPRDFLRMGNFGVKSLQELETELARYGLKLLGAHPDDRRRLQGLLTRERAELARLKAKYE